MNQKVRLYLIEAARKGESVFYSQLVKDCELDFEVRNPDGRQELKKILTEISEYEVSQGRHMLTAMAIGKMTDSHGGGFYSLAEKLGFGNSARLMQKDWGKFEAERCIEFWKDDNNFKNFGTTEIMPFFNDEELTFFKRWESLPYDKEDEEHVFAKNYIMSTVWDKSIFLARLIKAHFPDFKIDATRTWHQLGRVEKDGKKVAAAAFKPYTWVKLFRESDEGKDMFFTFGIEVHGELDCFLYKLDCQQKRDTSLTNEQVQLFRTLVPDTAQWNEIQKDELLGMNWHSLTDLCVKFIKDHIDEYDRIVESVWSDSSGYNEPEENSLIPREMPEGKHHEIPETVRNFNEVDVDFEKTIKEQKDLGNSGEELVRLHEIKILTKHGLHDEAAKVEIKRDGAGFDVYSFDLDGQPKYIEVKTTKGNDQTPFFLSDNELSFMRKNPQYCIYRVFNYNPEKNCGEFFVINDDTESKLIMKPTQYKVMIKKRNALPSEN